MNVARPVHLACVPLELRDEVTALFSSAGTKLAVGNDQILTRAPGVRALPAAIALDCLPSGRS